MEYFGDRDVYPYHLPLTKISFRLQQVWDTDGELFTPWNYLN